MRDRFAPGDIDKISNADITFNQNSGTVYMRYFHAGNRRASGDCHTACTYNLTDGTLLVGTTAISSEDIGGVYNFKSPTVQLMGGTFGFGDWGESLENKGSTIEFYGNMINALSCSSYTYDKFMAGEKPALTEYGTSNVTGDFTQTSGTMILDYGTNDNSDKLTATGNIAINGGEIYIAIDPYTVNPVTTSQFKAFQAGGTLTVANTVPVRTSYSGWKWKLNPATGDVTSDVQNLGVTSQINAGEAYVAGGISAPAMTIAGGSLLFSGGNPNYNGVTQTGGTVIAHPNVGWVFPFTNGGTNRWNLSGGGFYFTNNRVEASTLLVAHMYGGTFDVSGTGVAHIAGVELLAQDQLGSGAKGVFNQTGGEVYIDTLWINKSAAINQYNLSGGSLVLGELSDSPIHNYALGANAGEFNLTGGTAAIARSSMGITNKGSQIQILDMGAETRVDGTGNAGHAFTRYSHALLSDFGYLNDGNDATDRPTGFGKIGTMEIVGDYTQESGSIVFDIANDGLTFDTLNADDIFFIGGDLFVEYGGDELEKGTIFDIFGDSAVSFGQEFSTLVSNRDGTLYWQLSAAGAEYFGTAPPWAVPEPASWLLLGLGVAFWGICRTKRKFRP